MNTENKKIFWAGVIVGGWSVAIFTVIVLIIANLS